MQSVDFGEYLITVIDSMDKNMTFQRGLICCILCLCTLSVYGQNVKTINIDVGNARPTNVSEIAENVIPIVLDKSVTMINGNLFLTNDFLFITSSSSIVQYDRTGMFIRSINCEGYITYNVTCDTIKRELYVPVGNVIKCYDYSGKLIKTYQLTESILHILYFKEHLWVQTYNKQSDEKYTHSIQKINLSTGEITPLNFSLDLISTGSARIIRYKDGLVVSYEYNNALYNIQQDRVIPVVKWNISPPSTEMRDLFIMNTNGFSGDYLYINYRRGDELYTYLGNMQTGKKYNINNLVDDVFNTNNDCVMYPTNQDGYFFFIKGKYDIKGNSIGNIPLKNGPVLFIVKTK